MRDLDHGGRPRPGIETERVLDGKLEREIAGRPGIGAAEREHEIAIGGPGADAFELGQFGMNGLVGRIGKSVEIEAAVERGAGDRRARS